MGKKFHPTEWRLKKKHTIWKGFRDGLAGEDEKQAFDAVMDLCRVQAMAGSNACKPILFEPMVMSVLLRQHKQIRTLQRKIDALLVSSFLIEKPE